MLKVNFLSDYMKFSWFFGVNGAMIAAQTQAKAMQKYVNVLINSNDKDYDLIHSHGCLPYSFRIMNKARKLKKPIVITAHQTHHDTEGSVFLSNYFAKLAKKYLIKYYGISDALICPSENSKRIIKNELGIKKPMKVISNGVNTNKFKHLIKKRKEFRKNYNLNKPTIISVGMPTKRKGFHDFIEIAKKINECNFLWVGKRSFPLLQHNWKINQDNMIMPGYVEDIVSAYSGSDIFCFPSYYEGEGIVVLEAMSCGLPVIVRDLPVYKGRLTHGKNCLLARNNKEFIERINYLINNPKERKRISKNGLKTVKKHDIKETAKKIYKAYKEVI